MTDEAAYTELTDAPDASPGGQGGSETCLCICTGPDIGKQLSLSHPSHLPELQSLSLLQLIFFGPKMAIEFR